MELNNLTAISPVDGRYGAKLAELRKYMSEYGLIKHRVLVELEWFKYLSRSPEIAELPEFDNATYDFIDNIMSEFNLEAATAVKEHEAVTNHDVKACEYFIKDKFRANATLAPHVEFIHFACTSEDINNLAYALMLKNSLENIVIPQVQATLKIINKLAEDNKNLSMLSRTHGQPASPTTLGKEFAVFNARVSKQLAKLQAIEIMGKINGAVGNYNAHVVAYPDINWQEFTKDFLSNLKLTQNNFTTQIEPHDYIAEIMHAMSRINTVMLDMSRDIWGYIALNYFGLKVVKTETGSSTMPHKVNPIDFEQAEGNLGIANSSMEFLASKLCVSRWQRDLSDSTCLRNIGVGFAHSVLAYKSLIKGLNKLIPNETVIAQDLADNWAVLGEPIQTIMRKYNVENAYEKLKELTRGEKVTQSTIASFIATLDIPDVEKDKLIELTPSNYIGKV